MGEQQLRDEIARLKAELRRQDDERWEELKRDVHSINKSVKAIETTLNGPPDKAENGLKVRVDRLEQNEKTRSFWFKTSVGASVTAIAGGIWTWATTHKGP